MPKATVVIAADKAAPVEPLMQLLALLQTQSISQTQILMEH
ncbi:MAG: ExbD/TolR family protein, partial [Shewanella oncorhynchi]